MNPVNSEHINLDRLEFGAQDKNNISLYLLRLDKIHPEISGNKWFKLRFYLDDAIAQNKQTIATLGGAWSNHILATAAACKLNGLHSIGIIRGERPHDLSYTLKKATEYGMNLIFIPRSEYKQKIMPPDLASREDVYLIDEGGYGEKGMLGAATIAEFYKQQKFTHICCAVGTGTMMAGLIKASGPLQQILGISVLKNNWSIEKEIKALLGENGQHIRYSVNHNYHFGGYAKYNDSLIAFMNDFYRHTQVPTDFVYTAKMVYGVYALLERNFFPPGSRILLIHSGGLQGNNSLLHETLIF
ncbi:MAG: pyridoxal-phosphate dependent enzyme [Bacteroidetes bacterium]|nr:pyridoxal-phosphate dependent enzyme [Bacteroidota bacterium]